MSDTPSTSGMEEKDLHGVPARTRALCARFPDEYWRETDVDRRYPQEFVDTLTAAGLLSILIPTEYGGEGLGVTEASVVMEEINRSGGHSAACHAQMYTMGALRAHGSEALKDAYLPRSPLASCGCRPSPSPRPTPARTPPPSPRPRSATASTTSSPGTRTGPAGSWSPTWPSCSPAPARRPPTRPAG